MQTPRAGTGHSGEGRLPQLPVCQWLESVLQENTGDRRVGGEAEGIEMGVKAVGADAVCAVSADFAFQIWACPHTSRRSWQADSPWGTAAARGTPASAAPRTRVSLRGCLPRVPDAVWALVDAHLLCRVEGAGSGGRGGGQRQGSPSWLLARQSLRPSVSFSIKQGPHPGPCRLRGCRVRQLEVSLANHWISPFVNGGRQSLYRGQPR